MFHRSSFFTVWKNVNIVRQPFYIAALGFLQFIHILYSSGQMPQEQYFPDFMQF
jgi:hypothetical protein